MGQIDTVVYKLLFEQEEKFKGQFQIVWTRKGLLTSHSSCGRTWLCTEGGGRQFILGLTLSKCEWKLQLIC